MKKVSSSVLVVVAALAMAFSTMAQQQADHPATSSPLVQLLQSKGILTADEAAKVNEAASSEEANQRLAQMLVAKGLISQQEYSQAFAGSEQSAKQNGSTAGRLLNAVIHVPSRNSSGSGGVGANASTPEPPAGPEVIAAVAPVRVLPIDVPKQGGLIPDIKLGSGVSLKLYGLFKVSAVEDTASSGGPTFGSNDFPLPLLLADTGPTSDPQFHIKARSFRFGSMFEWVPKGSDMTVTGRYEIDNEGDYTNANNVNISSVRNGQIRLRLAWVRLDTHLADTPVFAEFGQDWALVSSSLPYLYESTGLGIGMGSLYTRVPMFRAGVQFHAGDVKIQPEVAIVLPASGSSTLTDEQRARFGDRAGAESNQPGIESRIVFQFPINHGWVAVPPAQVIVSGHHARMNEIQLGSALPTTSISTTFGCTPPATTCTTSVKAAFPRGVQVDNPQNVWTAEVQLPTPWVTFVAKYYQGDDLRWFFEGQVNTVFPSLPVGFTSVGPAAPNLPVTSFSGQTLLFGCTPATGGAEATCGGPIVVSALNPIRSSGGFLEAMFPLSRIFNADPAGLNSGWILHLGYGTDRVKAEDARRGNGLARTDLDSVSLTYKLNKWVTFVNEASYIQTRAATTHGKTFRGIPATQAHSWRNEFGTVFTF